MSVKDRPRVRVYWSKSDNDLMFNWDPGCEKSTARYLSHVFDEEVVSFLKERGYDITTLRFQIRKKVPALVELAEQAE